MLIALWGYARSGKNTVGEILFDHYGFLPIAFADPMRTAMLTLDPIIAWNVDGPLRYSEILALIGYDAAKLDYPEVRRLLQSLGTEVGRRQWGDLFWTDLAMAHVDAAPDMDWVFTDCRFINEAEAVRKRGGLVLAVDRPGGAPANDHISEIELRDYDFDGRIQNDGSLEYLKQQVRRFLK